VKSTSHHFHINIPLLLGIAATGLFVLFQAAVAFCAEGRLFLKGDGVTVYFDDSVRHHGQSVLEAYPRIKAEVEEKIGWKLKSRPSIYLIGSEKEFRKMGGSSWTAAFALIGRSRIVVDLSSFDRYFELNHTLHHELTHVLLHDYIRAKMPDWLEEGVCEWVADSNAKGMDGIRGYLGTYALYANRLPLSRLQTFSGNNLSINVAYSESGAFMQFISGRHGDDGIRRILTRIRAGDDVDRAFLATVAKTPIAVEQEWKAELAHRVRWLITAREALVESVNRIFAIAGRLAADPRQAALYFGIFLLLAASLKAISRILRR